MPKLEEIAELRRMKEHLAEWRKFELNELWENANEQKWRAKKRIQMKRRAEQKRKWKVRSTVHLFRGRRGCIVVF